MDCFYRRPRGTLGLIRTRGVDRLSRRIRDIASCCPSIESLLASNDRSARSLKLEVWIRSAVTIAGPLTAASEFHFTAKSFCRSDLSVRGRAGANIVQLYRMARSKLCAHNPRDVNEMQLSAVSAVRRVDDHLGPVGAEPRMGVATPFAGVFWRRPEVTERNAPTRAHFV